MRVVVLVCLVSLVSPGVVAAGDGPYVSANVGPSWLRESSFNGRVPAIRIDSEVEFDTGIHLGAALGYDFGTVRVEAEFGYRSHEYEEMRNIKLNGTPVADVSADGDLDAYTVLVNGFYDVDTGTRWTPYLGGGVGLVVLDVRDLFVAGIVRGSDDDTVFAYQAAGGLGYDLSDRFVADLSYRFVGTSDPDFPGSEAVHSHSLLAAIRYSFW